MVKIEWKGIRAEIPQNCRSKLRLATSSCVFKGTQLAISGILDSLPQEGTNTNSWGSIETNCCLLIGTATADRFLSAHRNSNYLWTVVCLSQSVIQLNGSELDAFIFGMNCRELIVPAYSVAFLLVCIVMYVGFFFGS